MARFDVYEFHSVFPGSLAVDVQADILAGLPTRVIVPLLPESAVGAESDARLRPVIGVNGNSYVLMAPDIAVTKAERLKNPVGNVERERLTIIGALDFLFQGF